MALIICSSCRRHHRASEAACPFCAAEPASRGSASAAVAGLAAAVGLSLAGCGPKATQAPTPPSDPVTQPTPGDGTPTDPPPPDDVTPQPPDDRRPDVQPLYGVDRD